jgi:Sporulation and spore germination
VWRRWSPRLALLLVLTFVAGCGPTAQSRPEPVQTNPVDESAAPVSPLSTDVVQIYLVRAERLVAVPRAGRTVSDAITSLSVGPSALDSEAGLHTALASATIELAAEHSPDVVTVEMAPEFTRLPERDRFLAAAQLVWTVTEVCCAKQVRVQLDARPVPIPTDSGPVLRAVHRDDYRSVGPD